MDERVRIYVSGFESWITSDWIKGPVQLHTRNFWAHAKDQPAFRLQPRAENCLFFQIYLHPKFVSYWDVTYLFCDPKDCGQKNKE